ncbi:MAG: hypothetical protein RL520_1453, partial [Pseudomonadota bacterium]
GAVIGRKAIDQAAMFSVPSVLVGRVVELAGPLNQSGIGHVVVRDQEQLGPLGLVTGLEAPRFEDVAGVVLVVVPVDRPVGSVMLPDHAMGLVGQIKSKTLDELQGALQVAFIAGEFVGGQTGFAHVHVRVLASVIDQHTFGGDLVGVGRMLAEPKRCVHAVKGVGDILGAGAAHPVRVGLRQQHKRLSVGKHGAVFHLLVLQRPCAQALLWTCGQNKALEVCQRVLGPTQVARVLCVVKGLRPVEDETCRAHQMAMTAFVHLAVVLEVMEKTTLLIQCCGFVELQRVLNMLG